MTKGNMLYQVKLILDNLEESDYKKIPKEDIEYINENMVYSDDITVDFTRPLEEQDIDEGTYEYLEKLINRSEKNYNEDQKILEKYEPYERIDLIRTLEKYKIASEKNKEIKKLIEEYRNLIKSKDDELSQLKENNSAMYNKIKRCPKLIRKIYFKEFEKVQLLK